MKDSEKVETELKALTAKAADSQKAKARSVTCPQKVVDFKKGKAGPGTLTGAEVAEVRKIDLKSGKGIANEFAPVQSQSHLSHSWQAAEKDAEHTGCFNKF